MVNIRMQNSSSSSQPSAPPVPSAPSSSSPSQGQDLDLSPKIAVIGVGGAGGNALDNMIESGQEGCEFLACNSDHQALQRSKAKYKVQLGINVTGGLGAGAKPEIGRAAAEESLDEVTSHLEGANMVFITAGMGGGTGTGAAPVIAKACREKGILTVGVVTKPFHFEGTHRMTMADAGIEEMQDYVDTLIVIPNQNLFRVADEKTTFAEAFGMADSVLKSGVCGVTDLMVKPGLVNLDFADIRTAMLEMGKAMMGTGEAEGDKRAIEAAESAINNPLLDDVSMKGARGVIINVTGGYDMTLFEADEACNRIRDEVDPNANIIFGATFDENMEGKMRVSIVATGIEKDAKSNFKGGGLSQKLERAEPKTVETGTATEGAADTKAEGSPVAQTQQSAAPTSAAPVSAPAMPSPPESDMLDQNRYVAPAAPQKAYASPVPENTALRGQVVNDSFIPPKPAEASDHDTVFKPAAAPVAPSVAAPAAVQAAQPAASSATAMPAVKPVGSSLKLNPPKMPTPQEPKQKKPNFFEKLSKSVQSKIEGLIEEAHQEDLREKEVQHMPAQPSVEASDPAPRPVMRSGGGPAQASLNIDAPAAKPKQEEAAELDIPAFLRRQAN